MEYHAAAPPKPLSFEIVPESEDLWRKEITAMTVRLQDKRKTFQGGEILRGVHPKSHGCLVARFTVRDDLPADLRRGLFAEPGRCFAARLRYSNADVLRRADIEKTADSAGNRVMKHGSRGMAIKVLDVGRPVLMDDGAAANQDFLLINTPEFAFRNVRDYRRLTLALLASPDGATADLFFLPGELLKRGVMDLTGALSRSSPNETPQVMALRGLFLAHPGVFEGYSSEDVQGVVSAAAVVRKIQSTPVKNPLDVAYFGAAPFRFGPDRVMRYSVTPATPPAGPGDFDHEAAEAAGDDYLAAALAGSMQRGETIRLRFRAQIAGAEDIRGRESEMIENASQAWEESAFPFTDLAEISIDPAEQEASLVDACKPYLFTPWHALPDHEPLGGINRLRKPVYATSATFRRTTRTS